MALLNAAQLQGTTTSAQRMRLMLAHHRIQSGVADPTVWAPTPLSVGPRVAGGANMSVDVARGSGWVPGLTELQGLYHVVSDATVNKTIGANATGNPRVDRIVAKVYDTADGGAGGANRWDIEVLPGTATAGATLDNLNGAVSIAAYPAAPHILKLADVLVPNGAATITASNIRDRRAWAHGASYVSVPTVSTISLTTGAGQVAIGPAEWVRRLEIGQSTRVRIRAIGALVLPATVGARITVAPVINGFTDTSLQYEVDNRVASTKRVPLDISWDLLNYTGSTLISLVGNTSVGAAAAATIDTGAVFMVRELVPVPRTN